MRFDRLVGLDAALVEQLHENARKLNERGGEQLVGGVEVAHLVVALVEAVVSKRHGQGEVGHEAQVLGRVERVVELDEELVLTRAHGVEVEQQDGAERIVLGVQAEQQLAQLEGGQVARLAAHERDVLEEHYEQAAVLDTLVVQAHRLIVKRQLVEVEVRMERALQGEDGSLCFYFCQN